MSILPASGYLENATRTHAEMKQAFEDQRDFIAERLGGEATSKLTIVAGSVTPTGGLHSIEVQTGATDDLDTIVTTNLDDGSTLMVYADNDAEDIVLKHESGGAGQLHMINNLDYTLNSIELFVLFVRIGTDWYETIRGLRQATATEKGFIELATNAELLAMVDTSRAVTADAIGDLAQYSEIYIDAASMIPCTTNGAYPETNEYVTNDIDMDYLAFDTGATKERAQFKLVMPSTWNHGTVKAKMIWSSDTGSTAGDTVEFGLKAGALSNDDTIDAALGTPQVVSDTLLANNGTDLQISSATPAILIGGTPALGDLIVFEVYRNTDGTDDMTEDAWLFGILIQIKHSNAIAAW